MEAMTPTHVVDAMAALDLFELSEYECAEALVAALEPLYARARAYRDHVKDEIISEMALTGHTDAEIASAMGVSKSTVLRSRKRTLTRACLPGDARKEAVASLHRRGMTAGEIATALGLKRHGVYKVLYAMGLSARH